MEQNYPRTRWGSHQPPIRGLQGWDERWDPGNVPDFFLQELNVFKNKGLIGALLRKTMVKKMGPYQLQVLLL